MAKGNISNKNQTTIKDNPKKYTPKDTTKKVSIPKGSDKWQNQRDK